MSIGKAIQFVKNACDDKDFRRSCIDFETKEDLFSFHMFDAQEFDDAINMQLVKCQSYEEAETYQQLRLWFTVL